MTSPESQLRNQKLKLFVEEALDAGVFYERDLQERIIPQILPFDEAVENLIGTFTNPSFQELRDLEARVTALPRGSWAIIRKEWDGGGCYTLMFSDGTGKLATGVAHDTYDRPLPFADAQRNVLGYEIYTMRHAVEAEREIAGDLKAIADNGFALYQKFECLKFGHRIFTTAQISEIRPNGLIILRLTLRGSRKHYEATVGARLLERRIEEAKERAAPQEARPERVGQTTLFLA
ncbi:MULTISPECIES: hypothetical protein [Microvirga]|uniref:hypothetical protein n=1 Tax=Microvirga TaxID=186650 RepID=UPI0021C8792B|nr:MULTISPECIES: hypothetical protein [unclassified Microvirga]